MGEEKGHQKQGCQKKLFPGKTCEQKKANQGEDQRNIIKAFHKGVKLFWRACPVGVAEGAGPHHGFDDIKDYRAVQEKEPDFAVPLGILKKQQGMFIRPEGTEGTMFQGTAEHIQQQRKQYQGQQGQILP